MKKNKVEVFLTDLKICVVQSSYKQRITNKLLKEFKYELLMSGFKKRQIKVLQVPNVSDIPIVIKALQLSNESSPYDGFFAIGCISPFEEHTRSTTTDIVFANLLDLSLDLQIPIFNVIIPDEVIRFDKIADLGCFAAESILKLASLLAKIGDMEIDQIENQSFSQVEV